MGGNRTTLSTYFDGIFLQSALNPQKYKNRFPTKFVVLGSNDGNNWAKLNYKEKPRDVDANDIDASLPFEYTLQNNMFSYSHYRLIIVEMFELPDNNSVTLLNGLFSVENALLLKVHVTVLFQPLQGR